MLSSVLDKAFRIWYHYIKHESKRKLRHLEQIRGLIFVQKNEIKIFLKNAQLFCADCD